VLPPSFGVPAPPAAHPVPPSWIFATSTVCSVRGFGHFAARSGQGSLRFTVHPLQSLASWSEDPAPSEKTGVPAPRNAVHTLRSIPLVDSRAASLRPLPSCRCLPPSRALAPKHMRIDLVRATRSLRWDPAHELRFGLPLRFCSCPAPGRSPGRARVPCRVHMRRNARDSQRDPASAPVARCLRLNIGAYLPPAHDHSADLTEASAVLPSADRLQGLAPPTSP
jgi:hypothetical protein